MGAGPLRLIRDPALSGGLRARGRPFRIETIDAPDPDEPELVRIAEGDRRLARRVRSAAAEGAMGLAILHVDLDAQDPSEGRANPFAAEGGLSLTMLEHAIDRVFERFEVAAAAITAYDPSLDEAGRVARAAIRVIGRVADGALAA